jgi:histidine ammonia-lyase
MVNTASENPVLLGDTPTDAGLAHHGGFHAAHLQLALDGATLAVAQTGQLVLARLAALIEPSFTGLAPFLGDGTPGASGVMILEYIAASALGELRAAATPAGLQSVTLSRGVEEDASFASLAARQALTAVENYRTLIACELVAAVRAVRMLDRVPANPYIASVMASCAALPTGTADRDLTADLELAASLLAELAAKLEDRS